MKDDAIATAFSEMLSHTDLDAYLIRIADPSLFTDITPSDTPDCSSIRSLRSYPFFFGKKKWIRRWFEDQAQAGFLRSAKLHFPLFSRHLCCMDDAGNVSFSIPLFFRKTDSVIKLVLHETAHLWLSEREYYPAMLALDRAFLARFGEEVCLSPVEHAASRLSIKMLSWAAESADDPRLRSALLEQIAVEEKKLDECLEAFAHSRK